MVANLAVIHNGACSRLVCFTLSSPFTNSVPNSLSIVLGKDVPERLARHASSTLSPAISQVCAILWPATVFYLTTGAMDAYQNLPRVSRDVKFRVLIIGRANAGKTSILQRVCDTTESPVIYSRDEQGIRKQV
jgi:hypothetical protein